MKSRKAYIDQIISIKKSEQSSYFIGLNLLGILAKEAIKSGSQLVSSFDAHTKEQVKNIFLL